MKLPVALAIVVGVIGAILTYLYVGPLGGLGLFVPATFLGAACFFAAGGDVAGLKKSLLASVWGVIWGTIALIGVGLVSGPILVGIVVGAATGLLILGGLIPLFDFIPGAVVAFATTAGFGLLTKGSGLDFSLPSGPFTVMLISFVIGGLYGYVSGILVGKLVGSASAPSKATAA
ncbi:MAG TPA: DUF1097 domain-containing protein [Pseudonocardia sp.]|nr:DUF1097 domain-containing protein [Pseudonocardia sp.]